MADRARAERLAATGDIFYAHASPLYSQAPASNLFGFLQVFGPVVLLLAVVVLALLYMLESWHFRTGFLSNLLVFLSIAAAACGALFQGGLTPRLFVA